MPKQIKKPKRRKKIYFRYELDGVISDIIQMDHLNTWQKVVNYVLGNISIIEVNKKGEPID